MFKYYFKNKKLINFLTLYKSYSDDSNGKLSNVRHFPPAIREWSNSVYSFNKNNSNYSPIKVNLLDNLLKNYFNLTNKTTIARSKRMRYLRRKSKTRKVFLSRPEIKQNNDKITITVYSFDRDRQMLIRKLFFYNRPYIYNMLNKFNNRNKLGKINKEINYRFPFSYSVKFIKELKLFRNKNYYKNKHLQQASIFQYIKYILSLLGIQLLIPIFSPLVIMKNDKKWEKSSRRKFKLIIKKMMMNAVKSKPNTLYWINYEMCSIEKIENKDINYNALMKKYAEQRKLLKSNNLSINKKLISLFKTEINNKLLRIVNKYLVGKFNFNNILLLKLFNNFYFKFHKFATMQMYKKRTRKMLKVMNLFTHSVLRFKTLLPVLKKTIDNLYNKKVELNIVNLKYIYLNSDILTQFLVFRIKKRISTSKMLKKIISKVGLPALPYVNSIANTNAVEKGIKPVNMYNNVSFLYPNKSFSLKNLVTSEKQLNNISNDISLKQTDLINKDGLTILLDKIYPKYTVQNSSKFYRSKINTVLSTIKYKWLLGIWIETKGRLTRRNTASRSVLSRIFKGNLKDKDKRIYLNVPLNVPTVVLRNNLRSNTQYTFNGSVRRIGAFGVKTWMTSK